MVTVATNTGSYVRIETSQLDHNFAEDVADAYALAMFHLQGNDSTFDRRNDNECLQKLIEQKNNPAIAVLWDKGIIPTDSEEALRQAQLVVIKKMRACINYNAIPIPIEDITSLPEGCILEHVKTRDIIDLEEHQRLEPVGNTVYGAEGYREAKRLNVQPQYATPEEISESPQFQEQQVYNRIKRMIGYLEHFEAEYYNIPVIARLLEIRDQLNIIIRDELPLADKRTGSSAIDQ